MLGNFLKIEYIVVCFQKLLNYACFIMGNDSLSSKQVGSGVTQRLAWIQPVCISKNTVPALKGLTFLFHTHLCQSWSNSNSEGKVFMITALLLLQQKLFIHFILLCQL